MKNEQLYKFFARQTTDTEDAQVRQWVEASAENEAKFIEERKFYDLAALLDCNQECEQPLAAEAEKPRRRKFTALMRVAAAMLVAVLSVAVYRAVYSPDASEYKTIAMQAIEVPSGQRLHIELSDGSRLWLNSNTRLEFPADLSGDSRIVNIDGEGYFEVSKDAGRPFIVNTPSMSVRVTGTTFNVDDYSDSDLASVSLVEGSVEVTTGSITNKMTAGQKLTYLGAAPRINDVETDELDWINGIISFRNLPLPDILKRFEKYYGLNVEYSQSNKMMQSQFSGRFYIDDGLEQALKTLQRDITFDYTIDRDARKVYINI